MPNEIKRSRNYQFDVTEFVLPIFFILLFEYLVLTKTTATTTTTTTVPNEIKRPRNYQFDVTEFVLPSFFISVFEYLVLTLRYWRHGSRVCHSFCFANWWEISCGHVPHTHTHRHWKMTFRCSRSDKGHRHGADAHLPAPQGRRGASENLLQVTSWNFSPTLCFWPFLCLTISNRFFWFWLVGFWMLPDDLLVPFCFKNVFHNLFSFLPSLDCNQLFK